MKLRFTVTAKADLGDIQDYFGKFGDGPAANVDDDIFNTLQLLLDFPRSGREATDGGFRKIATPRYGFVIIYRPGDDFIEVRAIIRHQDRTTS